MDKDLSSLIGGRYIYFKSLNSNFGMFKQLYQDASSRLNSIGSSLGANLSEDNQQSDGEQDFRFSISAYLGMLESMSNQLQSNERAFIESQIPLLEKAGIKEETINVLRKLGTGQITEAEYQSIISLINVIRYGGDLETLRTIIKEQKSNIEHMEANIKKMESEQGGTTNKTADLREMERKYVENYGAYKREFAGKLLRAVREQSMYHTDTLMDRYTKKLNSILKAIGGNEEFKKLIRQVVEQQPEDKVVIITEHDIFNKIFDQAVEEAEKQENKKKQGRTIAKKIMNNLNDEIASGSLSGQLNSEYVNVIKGNKRQVSIEEIAVTGTKGQLADALKDAANALEIIKKFGNKKEQNDNLKLWDEFQRLSKEGDEESAKKIKRQFNKKFKNSVLQSKTAKEMQKQLGSLSTKEKNQIINNLTDTLDLSFAKPAPRIDYSLDGLCTLTLSKSSLSEIVATKHNEIANVIMNKLPGSSINLKNDVFYAFKVNNSFAEVLAKNRMDQVVEDISTQIDSIIENSFGSFMQKYHDMTGGETDVEAANVAYINSMKQMVSKMKGIITSLEMNNEEQQKAWEELSNTFIASISVKEYTLYNNELGFHGGSLGSGGAPEGVVKNISRMYELGGITPMDKDALLFAILNCAPEAIGSALKSNLESYLLGGAALMMFDEGFTASKDYLEKMKNEIGINSLPRNLNLYFLNGLYVPASYIIYNIYQNLSIFYNRLNSDIENVKNRNRVVITNNATMALINKSSGTTLAERFSATAEAAMGQISIQFLFMAGMLDIMNNLSNAFNIK